MTNALRGRADHDEFRRASWRDGHGLRWPTWARLASLAGRAAYYAFVGPFQGKPLRWQAAISQATEVGVRALPILSLITFFIGLILALQSGYELRKLGAMSYVASTVAISVTRELGPLITAILVIGRSGSAFAAEIGTMRITEEIDALETMAIEPVDFLVTPKFLAMILMMPCLTTVGERAWGFWEGRSSAWRRPISPGCGTCAVRSKRSIFATSRSV